MAKKSNTKNTKKRSKKQDLFAEQAKVFITASFNNTLITFVDNSGRTLVSGSAGRSGFRGTRKSTPYAATTAVERVARLARERGVREVEVYIKGPGPGRDASLRALRAAGLSMSLIADVTPIPHNGVRPKKRRRV